MANEILWAGYPKSYTPGRQRPVQYIVLHYTAGHEGPNDAENGVSYDKKRTDGTSTHYFTDSLGPALQEVPDGDRSHAARKHGNEIGIQIEICGTQQTREQWLDEVSKATLETTAWLVATLLKRHNLAFKLLSVDETRAAYYAPAGQRPTGITEHARVTQAYPEDNGDHMDVGTNFPWDWFLDRVKYYLNPIQIGADMPLLAETHDGTRLVGDGIKCVPFTGNDEQWKNLQWAAAHPGAVLKYGTAPEEYYYGIIGHPVSDTPEGLVPHVHDVPAATTGNAQTGA